MRHLKRSLKEELHFPSLYAWLAYRERKIYMWRRVWDWKAVRLLCVLFWCLIPHCPWCMFPIEWCEQTLRGGGGPGRVCFRTGTAWEPSGMRHLTQSLKEENVLERDTAQSHLVWGILSGPLRRSYIPLLCMLGWHTERNIYVKEGMGFEGC